jgi:CheY-like chemotaxis protein
MCYDQDLLPKTNVIFVSWLVSATIWRVTVAGCQRAEAVELAQKEPDLILMDVRMPKMTGYEACRQMKSIPEIRDIPVVFLSAKGQESEIQTGLESGAEEYILKPFAPDELVKQVQAVLDRVAARRTAR